MRHVPYPLRHVPCPMSHVRMPQRLALQDLRVAKVQFLGNEANYTFKWAFRVHALCQMRAWIPVPQRCRLCSVSRAVWAAEAWGVQGLDVGKMVPGELWEIGPDKEEWLRRWLPCPKSQVKDLVSKLGYTGPLEPEPRVRRGRCACSAGAASKLMWGFA